MFVLFLLIQTWYTWVILKIKKMKRLQKLFFQTVLLNELFVWFWGEDAKLSVNPVSRRRIIWVCLIILCGWRLKS